MYSVQCTLYSVECTKYSIVYCEDTSRCCDIYYLAVKYLDGTGRGSLTQLDNFNGVAAREGGVMGFLKEGANRFL